MRMENKKNPLTAESLQKQQIDYDIYVRLCYVAFSGYFAKTSTTSLYRSFCINQMLSHVYPGAFQTTEVMEQLIAFVKHKDDIIGKLHGWYSKF